MIIGIDASRAFVAERTGTETYSYHVISEMLRLPTAQKHTFVLFIRPKTQVPAEITGHSNVIVKEIKLRYLWTQVGLAWETWQEQVVQSPSNPVTQIIKTGKQGDRGTGEQRIEVLWIPAHTLPVLRNPRVKTVVTIHGLEYKWLPEYRNYLQRWYLPLSTYYAAQAADQLIAVSESTKRELVNETGIDIDRVSVIYEGVEVTQNSEIKSQSRQKILAKYQLHNTKYILFVGTIQPRKNLVALIQAFAQVSRLYPDYKLVLAGAVGWLGTEVLTEPERMGILDKVVYTGRISQEELANLYLGARLYVQPSMTEGFGLPVLEAMQNGVPVIVSNGGALPEIGGEAARIVNLGENFVTQLAQAINELLHDPQACQTMITRGYKQVKYFTWKRAAVATLKVLVGKGYK